MRLLLLISLVLAGCTTTTTTSPDGTITTIREYDKATLKVFVQAGVEGLSNVAAAELARRAQEQ